MRMVMDFSLPDNSILNDEIALMPCNGDIDDSFYDGYILSLNDLFYKNAIYVISYRFDKFTDMIVHCKDDRFYLAPFTEPDYNIPIWDTHDESQEFIDSYLTNHHTDGKFKILKLELLINRSTDGK